MIEQAFIRRVWALLPPDPHDILVADRGFGRASLIPWLQKEQISDILPLKSDVYATIAGANGCSATIICMWAKDISTGVSPTVRMRW